MLDFVGCVDSGQRVPPEKPGGGLRIEGGCDTDLPGLPSPELPLLRQDLAGFQNQRLRAQVTPDQFQRQWQTGRGEGLDGGGTRTGGHASWGDWQRSGRGRE